MLVDKLHEIGAIKFGSFKLVSGIEAPHYIDLRIVPSYPEVFGELVSEVSGLVKSIPNYENCTLAGVPTAGISFATAVARDLKLPMIFVRKQAKSHGTCKMVEGVLEPETEVILIEDIVSKGGSVLKTVETLREGGALVNHAVAVIDQGVGGKEILEADGISLHTLTTTMEAVTELKKAGKIDGSQVKKIGEFVNAGK